jgi:cytochrome c peroxidase
MRLPLIATAVTLSLFLLATGCSKQASSTIDPVKLKMFAPLPDTVPGKVAAPVEEKITLGRMLYYDPRLSRDQKISCNSCHDLARYGVDGQPTSPGFKGQHGDRNSPSVYNAALHFVQFWDGRAANVEEQAKGPVLNPVEMAMPDSKAVIAVLNSIPEYVAAFKAAFPGDENPVNYDNFGIAVGAFERKLLTPARWDRFLAGDSAALNEEEKAGFNVFVGAGCQTCHMGALLGGNLYQKMGAAKPYHDTTDPGRFKVTNNEADRMLFKVPSLRNIEKTGPYFHNGKAATLTAAIKEMGDYQVARQLSDAEAASIAAWMKSLTGDVPADYIKAPELPKSTPRTPKPAPAD